MTDRELLQQALDALEKIEMGGDPRWANDVTPALRARLAQPEAYPENFIDALRFETALAQPEQEPVAWVYNGNLHEFDPSDWAKCEVTPLYTAPPQREWQGLTDEEYETMAEHYVTNCYFDTLKYARAIEAKLKEKNT